MKKKHNKKNTLAQRGTVKDFTGGNSQGGVIWAKYSVETSGIKSCIRKLLKHWPSETPT